MNETTEVPPASARRRLLRGAFAAPAVMTLFSGSVAAASVTCVARQQTSPIAPVGAPDNTWVRVRVYISGSGRSGNYGKLVSGADVASLMPPGGSYLANNAWQCVAIVGSGSGYTVGSTTISPNPSPVLASPAEFVAVRIDAAGKIVGVQGVSTANTALHVSCWTSFGGANPFSI